MQFGGQTPLKIARALEKGGLKILGTSPSNIDLAEDREKCEELVRDLKPLGLSNLKRRSRELRSRRLSEQSARLSRFSEAILCFRRAWNEDCS